MLGLCYQGVPEFCSGNKYCSYCQIGELNLKTPPHKHTVCLRTHTFVCTSLMGMAVFVWEFLYVLLVPFSLHHRAPLFGGRWFRFCS